MTKERMMTLQEAADYLKVTKQSVFIAVGKGKLIGHRVSYRTNGPLRWGFTLLDLENYSLTKYHASKRIRDDGTFVYDESKALLSPLMLADRVGVSVQMIYYWLAYHKYKSRYIVKLEDYQKRLIPMIDEEYKIYYNIRAEA
jgi:hypothetical protein